jgi:hypothetical protein
VPVLSAFATITNFPAPLLAEQGSCLSPAAVSDGDVERHAAALTQTGICLEQHTLDENGIAWKLTLIRNVERPGALWVAPHDDEDAAFSAGLRAVQLYGGVLVAVESGEQRLVASVDPNHIFATTPEAAGICPDTDRPAPLYTAAILAERNPEFPVIGLHSNWDGYREAGGQGTISVHRGDPKMIPFPSTAATGRFADEDTVVMLVGATPIDLNSVSAVARDWFNAQGVHVIYRFVSSANNECTLADFLTLNGISRYYNLEVEHGDSETLAALTDLLMRFERETEILP